MTLPFGLDPNTLALLGIKPPARSATAINPRPKRSVAQLLRAGAPEDLLLPRKTLPDLNVTAPPLPVPPVTMPTHGVRKPVKPPTRSMRDRRPSLADKEAAEVERKIQEGELVGSLVSAAELHPYIWAAGLGKRLAEGATEGGVGPGLLAETALAAVPFGQKSVLRSAIRDPKTGKVYTGYMHISALDNAPKSARARLYRELQNDTKNVGFLAGTRFLNREQANRLTGGRKGEGVTSEILGLRKRERGLGERGSIGHEDIESAIERAQATRFTELSEEYNRRRRAVSDEWQQAWGDIALSAKHSNPKLYDTLRKRLHGKYDELNQWLEAEKARDAADLQALRESIKEGKAGIVPGSSGAAVLSGLTGSIGGGAAGAALDDESPLRGAALGALAGGAGGVAVGRAAARRGSRVAADRARAEAFDRELLGYRERRLAGPREGMPVWTDAQRAQAQAERELPYDVITAQDRKRRGEAGAVGYSYETQGATYDENLRRIDPETRRFSALDRFIREGEFGRKSPKTIQQWLGWLEKNVGKAGYSKEEFEGYLKPALKEAQQNRKRTLPPEQVLERSEDGVWNWVDVKPQPQEARPHSFTRDELLAHFDESPLTIHESVYGNPKASAVPKGRSGFPKAMLIGRDGRILEALGPNGAVSGDTPLVGSLIQVKIGDLILPPVPGYLDKEITSMLQFARSEAGANNSIPSLKQKAESWLRIIPELSDEEIKRKMTERGWSMVEPDAVRTELSTLANNILRLPDSPFKVKGAKQVTPRVADAIPLSGMTRYQGYIPPGVGKTNYREHVVSAPALPSQGGGPAFEHSHWPSTENPLAHARTVDRGVGNNELHVIEFQSDWLQQAQKKGIRNPEEINRLQDEAFEAQEEVERLASRLDRFDRKRLDMTDWRVVRARRKRAEAEGTMLELRPISYSERSAVSKEREWAARNRLDDRLDRVRERRNQLSEALGKAREAVPPLPVKAETQTAVRLLTKSLLDRAVREGYKKVSFVDGKGAADMFSLRRHYTKLELKGNELKAFPRREGYQDYPQVYDVGPEAEHALEEYVGKEVAEKLRLQGKVEGVDLYQGGQAGIKEFYDKIVPQTVSSYIKELTGKAPELAKPSKGSAFSIKVSKTLKDVILNRGQVLPGLAITGGAFNAISDRDRELLGIKNQ